MNKTIISWATKTLNVVHGCSKPAAVPPHALAGLTPELIAQLYPEGIDKKWLQPDTSLECARCYAEALSNKRGWTPLPWLEHNEVQNVQLHPERFREIGKLPVKTKTLPPSERERIFICSMGDIFHRAVPDSFLHELFDWCVRFPHVIQLLTKRPERAAAWLGPWPENIWLGTSCGHPVTKWRIEYLRRSGAKIRFLSAEPLLGSMLPLDLGGIDQVIVGGESGAGFRKMSMNWVREVRDACVEQGVAFFMKQDAAFRTECRCYVVEENGECWHWQQFPGEMRPPFRVQPDNATWHREHFRIVGQTALSNTAA